MLIFSLSCSDYIAVDDEFWDIEFGDKSRKRVRKGKGEKEPKQPKKSDREKMLARYKVMQIRVQNRDGSFRTVKKKVRYSQFLFLFYFSYSSNYYISDG